MLKERLKQVAQLVTEDSIIDIGTDHGYLIIDLIKNSLVINALAVEITQGPLDNVQSNVKNHRLSAQVECVLSDGLTKVDSELVKKYKAISICGMGGALIAKILDDSKAKIRDKVLYLQPNNGELVLRKKLLELGFTIVDEIVAIDNDIYYEIIKAVPGSCKLTDQDLYFGPVNICVMSENFKNKHIQHYRHLSKINDNLIQNNRENQKIINELKMIERVLNDTIKAN